MITVTLLVTPAMGQVTVPANVGLDETSGAVPTRLDFARMLCVQYPEKTDGLVKLICLTPDLARKAGLAHVISPRSSQDILKDLRDESGHANQWWRN